MCVCVCARHWLYVLCNHICTCVCCYIYNIYRHAWSMYVCDCHMLGVSDPNHPRHNGSLDLWGAQHLPENRARATWQGVVSGHSTAATWSYLNMWNPNECTEWIWMDWLTIKPRGHPIFHWENTWFSYRKSLRPTHWPKGCGCFGGVFPMMLSSRLDLVVIGISSQACPFSFRCLFSTGVFNDFWNMGQAWIMYMMDQNHVIMLHIYIYIYIYMYSCLKLVDMRS